MNVFEVDFVTILQIHIVQFYVFLNLRMELCLVVQAKLWKIIGRICKKSSIEL